MPFWSNFEIANLDIFNNDDYENFFQYLDNLGGFYYERWVMLQYIPLL